MIHGLIVSKLSNYSKKIFTPIELNFKIYDLLKSIKIGIKFKYIISYLSTFFILIIVYNFIDNFFTINLKQSNFFLFLYIIIFIIILNVIDALNTKIAFEEMKGNFNYSIKDAYRFIYNNIYSIVLPNFLIILIMSIFLLLIFSFISLSKIILIGPLIYSIFYILIFILGLMVILSFIALIISIIYSPIIFPTFNGDSFTTIFQCFSLAWSNSLSIIIYFVVNFFISSIYTIFVSSIFYLNFFLINFYSNNNFNALWKNVKFIIINNSNNSTTLNSIELISTYILSLITLILILFIISIFFSIFNIGKFITYINLIKKHSNFNIISNNI